MPKKNSKQQQTQIDDAAGRLYVIWRGTNGVIKENQHVWWTADDDDGDDVRVFVSASHKGSNIFR